MYEFLRTKEEKLGPFSGTTAALWYLTVLSPGVVASLGFPGRSSPPGFLFFSFSCGVAPNPRILLCNLRIQYSNSLRGLMSLLFFLYFAFISRLDALHSVLNSLYLHTLPMRKLHQ